MSRWILDHIQAAHDAWKRTSDRLTQFVILVSLLGILLAIPVGSRRFGLEWSLSCPKMLSGVRRLYF